jgi:hypothetical protein
MMITHAEEGANNSHCWRVINQKDREERSGASARERVEVHRATKVSGSVVIMMIFRKESD